jgi:hypothetical protein
MPSRERVEAFIESVVGGDHVRAIADYYLENASMQENLQTPRQGRANLMAHEAPQRASAAALGGRSHRR